MDPIALHLPPGLAYGCLRCGRSCEDWSEIGIEAEEAERLRRLPLLNPRLEADGGLPYEPDARREGRLSLRLVPRADGARGCVLLDRDGSCAVHAAHGGEVKPVPCRAFPWFFVVTPGGVFAALSFACTAVQHQQGEPVSGQEAEVRATFAFASHRERRGFGIRLAPGEVLRWEEYLRIERELVGLLDRAASVADGLIAQAEWLRREAGLRGPIDRRRSPRLAGHALAWLEAEAGPPPRFRPPVAALGPPAEEDLLRRWIGHRLFRKDLLRGGEVLFAHGLLLGEYALARDWARRSPGGLADAVGQVERGLAVHSELVARLEGDPARRQAFGRLMAAPAYAASLVGGRI